jgi:hypothetical protein
MDAATEAVIATVAAALAALAGLAAVVVGTINVVLARKLLVESRATIKELKKLQEEGQGTIDELRKLTTAAHTETQAELATTLTLHMILTEAQAARELELLGNIASDVYRISSVTSTMGRTSSPPGAWQEFQSGQRLLGAHVAGLPSGVLEACRFLASPQADPRYDNLLVTRAGEEIQSAIEGARERLADATAAADEQLKQFTQSQGL